MSWTQGLARLAQALVANTLGHRADVAEWDGNAKQQAARQSAHLGTTVTPNLAANPYRSRGERARLIAALKGSDASSAQSSLSQGGATMQPGTLASAGPGPQAISQGAPTGTNALTSMRPPADPLAPLPDRQAAPRQAPPQQMDRYLHSMPADAAIYFEQADPTAYWSAVSKAQEPSDDERYAANFGQPGSQEYNSALQDYRLRGWGPTGAGVREDMQSNSLAVRTRGQDLTHQDRVDGRSVTIRGQDLSHDDRQASANFAHTDRQDALAQRGTIAGQTEARVRGSAGYQGIGRFGYLPGDVPPLPPGYSVGDGSPAPAVPPLPRGYFLKR